jgi:hypothetical protein
MSDHGALLETPHVVAAVLLLAALAACDVDQERAHGIGSGVITSLGSVQLDDDGSFHTDLGTRFLIDGEEFENLVAFEAALGGPGNTAGVIAVLQMRDDVDEDFTSGSVARVHVRTALTGPVTSTAPLRVLGRDVVVRSETVLIDIEQAGDLTPGDTLEVSGFTRQDNTRFATRVRPRHTDTWKLTGIVTGNGDDEFSIASQLIVLAGARVSGCDGEVPPLGSFVQVEALADAGFGADVALVASRVVCKSVQLTDEIRGVAQSAMPARIEGFIGAAVANNTEAAHSGTFTVGAANDAGQAVSWNDATTFSSGMAWQLDAGERVRVHGQLDPDTRVLAAARVVFTQPPSREAPPAPPAQDPLDATSEAPARIDGPLHPLDVDTAQRAVTVLGVTVRAAPGILDDDGFFDGNPSEARDVRIRGFVQGGGEVFATRIDDRGRAGSRDLRLEGPARDIDTVAQTLTVLGTQIRPDSQTTFRNAGGRKVSARHFFESLAPGMIVRIDRDRKRREVIDEINPPDDLRVVD